MTTIISSQRYIDEDIVDEKIRNKDFEVHISPRFYYEGAAYQVVTDGHHSLIAAKRQGVAPVFIVDTQADNDRIGLLEKSQECLDDFLAQCYVDSDWYDIATGKDVW